MNASACADPRRRIRVDDIELNRTSTAAADAADGAAKGVAETAACRHRPFDARLAISRPAEGCPAAHGARSVAALPEAERVRRLRIPRSGDERAVDPWQRKMYDDWAARLGEQRMHGVLRALDDQLRNLLRLTRKGGSDALHRLAHDVASTAGMLGFAEVTRRCRALLEGDGDGPAAAALGAALEAAIVRLERHFAAAKHGAAAA